MEPMRKLPTPENLNPNGPQLCHRPHPILTSHWYFLFVESFSRLLAFGDGGLRKFGGSSRFGLELNPKHNRVYGKGFNVQVVPKP